MTESLSLSFQVAAVATLLAAVFGVLFAEALSRRPFPGRDLVDVLITAPMVLQPTVLGYYLLVLIGRSSAIGRAFEAATGTSIVFTKTGAIVAALVGAFPIVVKSSRAALEAVDSDLLRAARTLGAGPVRTFLTVRLPLAQRGIVAAVMLAFAKSLGDFGVTLMIAGNIPGRTQTAALAIYDAIQSQRDEEAVAMVVILTGTALVTLYVVNKLTHRVDV